MTDEKKKVEVSENEFGFDHTEETVDELTNGKGEDE